MKLNPDVYVHAAELVDAQRYNYTCNAIATAADEDGSERYYRMHDAHETAWVCTMQPTNAADLHAGWWGANEFTHDAKQAEKFREERVLALLFMAVIVEAGDEVQL